MLSPKKVRNILPEISVQHKEDLALLQKLNMFYWERIREVLTGIPVYKLSLTGLGEFYIKHWKVKKAINYYKEKLNKARGVNSEKYISGLESKIIHLEKLAECYDAEQARKQDSIDRKNEYYKSLEETRADN